MPTPQAKTILWFELAKWQGVTLYFPQEKRAERRIRAACGMLENSMSAADSALAIHARFGITLRQAQRDVKQARKILDDKKGASLSRG